MDLNYTQHLLVLGSVVAECVLIFAFASLVGISIDIMSFAVGLKICGVTAGMKIYKSIIKQKRKKQDKIDIYYNIIA